MIHVAQREGHRRGADNIRWQVGRAEDLAAEAAAFELITIGNAFHRLDRPRIAQLASTLLAPRGYLALLWSNCAWNGTEEWQRVVADVIKTWTKKLRNEDATPLDQRSRTHEDILQSAGLADVTEYRFPMPYQWTIDEITGYVYSTSVASKRQLGDKAEAFEADLRKALLSHDSSGRYEETINFAYVLSRHP